MPNPSMNKPKFRNITRDSKNRYINIPTPKKGVDIASTLSLNPSVATIQAVTVVPKLAPKTTPMAFLRLSTPAPKKANTIKVTKELLCSTAVITAPTRTALSVLFVKRCIQVRKAFPAISRMAFSS